MTTPASKPPLDPASRKAALEWVAHERRYNSIKFFSPYAKQREFMAAGATKRERLLTAGNQLGKTAAGAMEASFHLTGRYPHWWIGRRWDRPTRGWICGVTALAVRDGPQRKLCGEPGVEDAFGTGMIPKECFVERPSLARGITDLYDTLQVRHVTGGISVARLKSYEQGREKFQGESLDWIWNDEESPFEIYTEELARLTATGGMIFTTFTSLNGDTGLTDRFFKEESPDRALIKIGLKDAEHIKPEAYDQLINAYPEYEREARVHGGILRGHGRIFPLSEDLIKEPVIDHIPAYWTKLWGIDFGIGHPFAAVLIAWDRDNDIVHVLHAIKIKDQLPIQHAASMRHIGNAVPVAWPQDGTHREKSSGAPLASLYKKEGLNMLPEHATWPEGGVSTWAGVEEMLARMTTGRLKVASHLSEWFDEFRNYHQENGQIVKVNDDLLSATRVALMMKRYAKAVGLGRAATANRREPSLAKGLDFDLHSVS